MRLAALLFFFGPTVALTFAEPALFDGESLTYKVGWGLFLHAGEISISAQIAPTVPEALCVTTTTATRGVARVLFKFEGRAEALLEAKTGRLLSNIETSRAPNKETKVSVTLDYASLTAHYVNGLNAEKNTTIALPPGDPLDLIMSLVQTRLWNLKPGDQRDALVLFEDEFYDLTIHALRYEDVTTPLGTFNTLVLEPRMEKTPPKGMFKRGSAVSVWISQDERRLPVKFKVEFKFGAGVATLIKYQPPAFGRASVGAPSASAKSEANSAAATVESDAKNPRS